MRSSTIITAVFVFISTALTLPLTTHVGSNPSTPVAERRWSPLRLLSRAPTPKPFDFARLKSSPDELDKGLRFRASSANPVIKSIWGRAAQVDLTATTTIDYPTDGSGADTSGIKPASEEAPPPPEEPYFDDADAHALEWAPPEEEVGLRWGASSFNKAVQAAQS
ncbi:MAG: hypothetical protein Q9178_004626 [Gyalolechia marmorata]